jgi:DNA-binding transcriptional ArsR family regulator
MDARDDLGPTLDALGSGVRRAILRHLREGPQPVGALADALPVSRPAVSKHLRILEEAGLVSHQPAGTSNIFRLEPAGFQPLQAYLSQFWSAALTSFKRLAEAPPTRDE